MEYQCYNFFKREKKHHHVLYAWWFQMLIKFFSALYLYFSWSYWIHVISILILNSYFKFHEHMDSYCFNLLLKTIVSIFYWIDEVLNFFVSIYHWIHASILIIIFNCCSNSHIKNTNTIQKLHNIDTTNTKRHIRCWVGSS